jgi:hypothetical protein
MTEIATFAAIAFACAVSFLFGYALGETRTWQRLIRKREDEAPGDNFPHHGEGS